MLSLFLFIIGILGFILNRKNIILMIISIEIMLLAVTLLILISSYGFDDNAGQTFAIYIIAIAGAESVIGLSILVAYYRFIASNFLNSYNFFNTVKDEVLMPYNDGSQFKLSRSTPKGNSFINTKALQQIKSLYSTAASQQSFNNLLIEPLFITGLFDAEGSFVVTILKNPKLKTG
jgi:NADH-ubiquinone oxidoreductase chain 4L